MSRSLSHAFLLLTAFIWGITFVFQTTGMETLGPFGFSAFRFLVGSIAILPIALWEMRKVNLWTLSTTENAQISIKERRNIFWGTIILGVIMFIGSALQQVSLGITSVANTAFLTTLYVPLVPILGFVLFSKNIGKWRWFAVGIFVVGSWMMSGVSPDEAVIGDIMVVIGAVFWAFHIMLVGWLAQHTKAPFQLAFMQTVITAVLSFIVLFMVETFTIADVMAVMPEILFAGVMSTGLGFTLQLVAQQHCSNAAAAILLSLEGVIAALAGWVLLDQAMVAIAIMGAALIFIAVLVVELTPEGPQHQSESS